MHELDYNDNKLHKLRLSQNILRHFLINPHFCLEHPMAPRGVGKKRYIVTPVFCTTQSS